MKAIRFSGFRFETKSDGRPTARLVVPGFDPAQYKQLQVFVRQGPTFVPYALTYTQSPTGAYWQSADTFDGQTDYYFEAQTADGQTQRFLDSTQQVPKTGSVPAHNRVDARLMAQRRIPDVMAHLVPDCLMSPEGLETLLNAYQNGQNPQAFVRNHYNLYNRNSAQQPTQSPQAIQALLPQLRQRGYTALLMTPFVGGDALSSHGYWTTNPYALRPHTFPSTQTFAQTLVAMLKNGIKPYADGAVVNQGLNGVQYLSLLRDGKSSPYWDWFIWPGQSADSVYPSTAYANQKLSLGVLPVYKQPTQGAITGDQTAYDWFDFRILNDPDAPDYDRRKPTTIQLYDPTLETAEGQPLTTTRPIRSNRDSVIPYQFPVDPKTLRAKKQQVQGLDDIARKKVLMEWDTFRLCTPDGGPEGDNSGKKWDGKGDVCKMNTQNPQVRAYLQNALLYWTRFVRNTYLEAITQALYQQRQLNPEAPPAAWLTEITGSSANSVLPPVRFATLETLSPAEIEQALKQATASEHASNSSSKALSRQLTQTMLSEILPMTVGFPADIQALLSYPKLLQKLQQKPFDWLFTGILKPLKTLPLLGTGIELLQDWRFPRSLKTLLEQKIQKAIKALPPEAQAKLNTPLVRSIVSQELMETVYLQLLSGQTDRDPAKIAEGVYNTLPLSIIKADPVKAEPMLRRHLAKHVKQLDAAMLTGILNQRLASLDPALLSLAEAVMQKRELGLNWRIDAAKDIGDMDVSRDEAYLPSSSSVWAIQQREKYPAKDAVFLKQFEVALDFWKETKAKIQSVWPAAKLIGEFTHDAPLCSNHTFDQAKDRFLAEGAVDGIPNFSRMYGSPFQLVANAHEPWKYDGDKMWPSQFLNEKILGSTQSIPHHAAMFYQQLIAGHDQPMALDTLMKNRYVFGFDMLPWVGIKNAADQAFKELAEKVCFEPERQQLRQLGVQDVSAVLRAVQGFLSQPDALKTFSPMLQDKWSNGTQAAYRTERPTTTAEKAQLIAEIFDENRFEGDKGPFAGLNLSTDAKQMLKQMLLERITEPSEARATRAVMVNELQRLNISELQRRLPAGSNIPSLSVLQKNLYPALYQAITQTIQSIGPGFGYQPLDIALDQVLQQPRVDEALRQIWGSKQATQTELTAFKQALKWQLVNQALKPALDKYLRLVALLVGGSGSPSLYLHDDMANPGGGEGLNNTYLTNRNVLRTDRAQQEPIIQQYQARLAKLLNLRSQYQVLNDGEQLNPIVRLNAAGEPDIEALKEADRPVVPMIKDNGTDQAILLVNTGDPVLIRPKHPEGVLTSYGVWPAVVDPGDAQKLAENPVERETTYREIETSQPVVKNYILTLAPQITVPGTVFEDPETRERFVVQANYQLLNAKTRKGLDIGHYRLLLRQPSAL